MRHYRNDIGITQQVAGNPAEQALPGAGMAETTNHQKLGANLAATAEHAFADIAAAATDNMIIRLTAMALEITGNFFYIRLTLFRYQHAHLLDLRQPGQGHGQGPTCFDTVIPADRCMVDLVRLPFRCRGHNQYGTPRTQHQCFMQCAHSWSADTMLRRPRHGDHVDQARLTAEYGFSITVKDV